MTGSFVVGELVALGALVVVAADEQPTRPMTLRRSNVRQNANPFFMLSLLILDTVCAILHVIIWLFIGQYDNIDTTKWGYSLGNNEKHKYD